MKNKYFLRLENSKNTYIQLPNPLTAFVVLVKWSKVMKRRTYFVLLKLLLVSVLWRCCCCVVSRFMMVFLLSITVLKDIIFVKPFMIMTNWCLCLFIYEECFENHGIFDNLHWTSLFTMSTLKHLKIFTSCCLTLVI